MIGGNPYRAKVKVTRRRSCKAVPYREGSCSGPVVGASLVENAGQVIDHGLFAQDELFGNLAVTLALRNQAQDFHLTRAQASRK